MKMTLARTEGKRGRRRRAALREKRDPRTGREKSLKCRVTEAGDESVF